MIVVGSIASLKPTVIEFRLVGTPWFAQPETAGLLENTTGATPGVGVAVGVAVRVAVGVGVGTVCVGVGVGTVCVGVGVGTVCVGVGVGTVCVGVAVGTPDEVGVAVAVFVGLAFELLLLLPPPHPATKNVKPTSNPNHALSTTPDLRMIVPATLMT